ncbi:MAG: ARMT1-like domain-containing protein [Candidatus Tantalella remota]|nr:ARMT1-like domain-containing protein [Candidatus Tantalella remota]
MKRVLKKTISLIVILTFSLNTFSYGLGTLPAAQNPIVKRKVLAELYRHSNVRLADSDDARRLLDNNDAKCLLLSSGKYLIDENMAADDITFLRSVLHEDIEALMQILKKKERFRYQGIKEVILNNFPPARTNELPLNLYVNDTVAKAFEWLILLNEGVILRGELPFEDAIFLNKIEPVINANKHNYFTGEFWEASRRNEKIRLARNSGMRFYQVSGKKVKPEKKRFSELRKELWSEVRKEERDEDRIREIINIMEKDHNAKVFYSSARNTGNKSGLGERLGLKDIAHLNAFTESPIQALQKIGLTDEEIDMIGVYTNDHGMKRPDKMAVAIQELARNIWQHAIEGFLIIRFEQDFVEASSVDKGNGPMSTRWVTNDERVANGMEAAWGGYGVTASGGAGQGMWYMQEVDSIHRKASQTGNMVILRNKINRETLDQNVPKGSPADLLEMIRDDEGLLAKALSGEGISVREMTEIRPFAKRTVAKEFEILKDLGIFVPAEKTSHYRFNDTIMNFSADLVKGLIKSVSEIRLQVGEKGEERPLHRYNIPKDKRPEVKELIEKIVRKTKNSVSGHRSVVSDFNNWDGMAAFDGERISLFRTNASKFCPEDPLEFIEGLRKHLVTGEIAPVRVDIDISNLCNNDCVMCFDAPFRKSHEKIIHLDKGIKMLDDFAQMGVKSLRFTGGGEPLTNPNFLKIVSHAHALGFKLTLETNGDGLNDRLIDVISRYMDHIRVSVNAATNETRVKVHRPKKRAFTFDRLVENLGKISQKRHELGRDGELLIGATFLIMPENHSEVEDFIRIMKKAGVNWVAVRKTFDQGFYKEKPHLLEAAMKKFKEARERYEDSDFRVAGPYGVTYTPKKDFDECLIGATRIIVLANSTQSLCCMARDGINLDKIDLGEIGDEDRPITSLMERRKKKINRFMETAPSFCDVCIDMDFNHFLNKARDLLEESPERDFRKVQFFMHNGSEIMIGDKSDASGIIPIFLPVEEYRKIIQGEVLAVDPGNVLNIAAKVDPYLARRARQYASEKGRVRDRALETGRPEGRETGRQYAALDRAVLLKLKEIYLRPSTDVLVSGSVSREESNFYSDLDLFIVESGRKDPGIGPFLDAVKIVTGKTIQVRHGLKDEMRELFIDYPYDRMMILDATPLGTEASLGDILGLSPVEIRSKKAETALFFAMGNLIAEERTRGVSDADINLKHDAGMFKYFSFFLGTLKYLDIPLTEKDREFADRYYDFILSFRDDVQRFYGRETRVIGGEYIEANGDKGPPLVELKRFRAEAIAVFHSYLPGILDICGRRISGLSGYDLGTVIDEAYSGKAAFPENSTPEAVLSTLASVSRDPSILKEVLRISLEEGHWVPLFFAARNSATYHEDLVVLSQLPGYVNRDVRYEAAKNPNAGRDMWEALADDIHLPISKYCRRKLGAEVPETEREPIVTQVTGEDFWAEDIRKTFSVVFGIIGKNAGDEAKRAGFEMAGIEAEKGLFNHPAGDPLIIIVSGPSGAGKDAAIAKLTARLPGLERAVSTTTRKPRSLETGEMEEDGVHYFFTSKENFKEKEDEGAFLQDVEVRPGEFCGLEKDHIDDLIAGGKDIIVNVDPEGARQIREMFPKNNISIFIKAESMDELTSRLKKRGSETEEEITVRMRNAKDQMEHSGEFDFVVTNERGELETTAEVVRNIVRIKREEAETVRTGSARKIRYPRAMAEIFGSAGRFVEDPFGAARDRLNGFALSLYREHVSLFESLTPSQLLKLSASFNRFDSLLKSENVDIAAEARKLFTREEESEHLSQAVKLLERKNKVGIVLDNYGELLIDLMIAARILEEGKTVKLFTRKMPFMISDVTKEGLIDFINTMADTSETMSLAVTLEEALRSGTLQMTATDAFTDGEDLYAAGKLDILKEFAELDLVVIKGDWNYKTAIGMKSWRYDDPLEETDLKYFPSDVILLRTVKSPVIVGEKEPFELTDEPVTEIKVLAGKHGRETKGSPVDLSDKGTEARQGTGEESISVGEKPKGSPGGLPETNMDAEEKALEKFGVDVPGEENFLDLRNKSWKALLEGDDEQLGTAIKKLKQMPDVKVVFIAPQRHRRIQPGFSVSGIKTIWSGRPNKDFVERIGFTEEEMTAIGSTVFGSVGNNTDPLVPEDEYPLNGVARTAWEISSNISRYSSGGFLIIRYKHENGKKYIEINGVDVGSPIDTSVKPRDHIQDFIDFWDGVNGTRGKGSGAGLGIIRRADYHKITPSGGPGRSGNIVTAGFQIAQEQEKKTKGSPADLPDKGTEARQGTGEESSSFGDKPKGSIRPKEFPDIKVQSESETLSGKERPFRYALSESISRSLDDAAIFSMQLDGDNKFIYGRANPSREMLPKEPVGNPEGETYYQDGTIAYWYHSGGMLTHPDGEVIRNIENTNDDSAKKCIRGVLGHEMASESGFIRLAVPTDREGFLSETNPGKDMASFDECLVVQVFSAVKVLIKIGANPDKKLILDDDIKEVLLSRGLFIPEGGSLGGFLKLESEMQNLKGSPTGIPETTKDAEEAAVLAIDLLHAQLQEDRTYTIKYDQSKLSRSQVSIIRKYADILDKRSKADIKARPFSSDRGSDESLIAVYCKAPDFEGEGHVDVEVPKGDMEEYLLRVTGMVNIALAASNIPENVNEEDMHMTYGPIVGFIKNQYKLMLGSDLDLPDTASGIAKVLRHIVLVLPEASRMSYEAIEEFNMAARKALIAA